MYQYNMIQEGCNTGNGRKTWLSQSRKIYRTRCTGKVNLEKSIKLDALGKSTQNIIWVFDRLAKYAIINGSKGKTDK